MIDELFEVFWFGVKVGYWIGEICVFIDYIYG